MQPQSNAFLVLVAVPAPSAYPTLVQGTVNVPAVGQTWTLAPGKNIIGREAATDVLVVLPWSAVSRRHAEVELFAQGMWEITDIGRNGTLVNGQRLQPGALHSLTDGDRICIVDVELRFCFKLDPI